MADLLKLQGIVDIDLGRSESNLKKIDSAAGRSRSELGRFSRSARDAGGAIQTTAGNFDRAASSAGRLGNAVSNLRSKLGGLRSAGGGGGMFGDITALAKGNLLSGGITSILSGITGALKSGAAAGIEYNSMLEKASISFTTLLGSSTKASEHLQSLQRFAESTPFEFPDLIKASQRMQAMGFSADKILPSLRSIGDAVGAVGGGKEELDGIVMALGQMQTKGKVSAEEMNQLAERGIPAWDLLSKAIGRTKEETIKLSEQGRLGGARAVEGIVAMMGERFGGQMDQLSRTYEGQLSNLEDIKNRKLGEATKGAFGELKLGIGDVSGALGGPGAAALVKQLSETSTREAQYAREELKKFLEGGGIEKTAQGIGAADAGIQGLTNVLKGNFSEGGKQLGQAITEGFSLGLKDSSDPIDRKAYEYFMKFIEGAKGVLGVKSPSTVFAEIGGEVMAGFYAGIDGQKKTPKLIDIEAQRKKLVDDLRKLRDDPAVKAMLATIGSAEGTGDRYDILFGGGTFDSYAGHPNQKVTRKLKGAGTITSTAAGRYQFKKSTWDMVQGRLGLTDFSPESQDLAAIYQMRQRGMLGPLKSGDVAGAFTAGNREWASFPGSPYGQPTKKAETLIDVYGAALEKLTAPTQAVAQTMQSLAATLPPVAQSFERIKASAADMPLSMGDRRMSDPLLRERLMGEASGFKYLTSDMAELPKDLNKLSTETKLANAALNPLPVVMEKAASQAGQFADAISDAGSKTKEAVDTLAPLRESVAGGFDSVIDALTEGSGRLKDAALNAGRDFLKGLQGSLFSSLSGGRANSPGQFFAQSLFGGNGGGTAGGNFLTGGFAGGNPAAAILGGGNSGGGGILGGIMGGSKGGGIGGLLGKIPGLGGIFGGAKAGANIGTLPGVTKFPVGLTGAGGAAAGGGMLAGLGATGLLAGGGLLGSFAGKSQIGKLMGSVGGTLLGGFAAGSGLFGGAMAGALPALFSNPITAIIGAGLVGGALLSRLFGGGIEKSLKKLTQGEYGIKIDDGTAKALRSIGESKFGKQFKGKQIETIRLPESRDLLAEYASATGQKGNAKLFTTAQFSDPYSSANLMKREFGGRMYPGVPSIVGERRPEVFVPDRPGTMVPSLAQFMAGSGNAEMATAIKDLRRAITHLQSMPPDQVVSMARPSTVARQIERDYRQRGDSSIATRNLIQKR